MGGGGKNCTDNQAYISVCVCVVCVCTCVVWCVCVFGIREIIKNHNIQRFGDDLCPSH